MKVRKAEKDEAPAISMMISTAHGNGDFVLPRPEEEIKKLIDKGNFFVAVEDEKVVGCASLEEYFGIAELRSLVVDSQWRGKDAGKSLVQGVENMARGFHGVLYAFADESLLDFYQGQGFQDAGRFLDLVKEKTNKGALKKMEKYCLNCERYQSGICQEHVMYKPLL